MLNLDVTDGGPAGDAGSLVAKVFRVSQNVLVNLN